MATTLTDRQARLGARLLRVWVRPRYAGREDRRSSEELARVDEVIAALEPTERKGTAEQDGGNS